MSISVTKHAIKRYRERMFDYHSSPEKIKELLIKIAHRGKTVQTRPNNGSNCTEVRYRSISIVLVQSQDESIIITCLGDMRYRKWVKHQDMHERLPGRLLYPVQRYECPSV